MKSNILKVLKYIILIFVFLYLQIFVIMYNVKVISVTEYGIMLSVFGQNFVYEYDNF